MKSIVRFYDGAAYRIPTIDDPSPLQRFIAEQQLAGADFRRTLATPEIHLPLYDAAGVRAKPGLESLDPVNIRGRERCYHLFPAFRGLESPQLDDVVRLISVLDRYRADAPSDLPAQGEVRPG